MKMNKKLISYLPLAFLAALLGGCCAGYQPPRRPVAYMVPTMVSGTRLRGLPRQDVAEAELEEALRAKGVWEELLRLGMTPSELRIVRRGLKNYGYAELDAHRCEDSSLECVIFTIADGKVHLDLLTSEGVGGDRSAEQ